MAYLLGWKDILRPIRDGYRHLFPSPDTGPTPEERRKQRAIDRLKGFTYFDTFEQLEAWTDGDADPLQRANTPLLARSISRAEELAKASVLLCHDYAGNYHDYEGALSAGLEEEKYACEYLQHVDAFIYFSHKLVCVPPPSWTNTLHRNGVRALGTILIEPQTPESQKLFHHGDDGLSFPLATKLARIADYYRFDGWLVNIEKPFPAASWDTQFLTAFLRQLRTELGVEKQLIWYDALTASNTVSYQNALNTENLTFAKACGAMLTNYCWKEKDAANSMHEALQNKLSSQYVYFGIDVWAQNATKLSQPRVTYPEYGGGGTNTGVAVAKLAELGLSAGIFAPAWTFEHFSCQGREVEQMVWDGGGLPEDIVCSCGDCSQRHLPNRTMPVTRYAKLSNAGSETFFFTDFSRAFCTHGDKERKNLFSGHRLHAQLGSQSILPLRTESLDISCPMRHRVEHVKGRSQLVIETCKLPWASLRGSMVSTDHGWSMPLFKLNMPANGSLRLQISYRAFLEPPQHSHFYMNISGTTHRLVLSDIPRIDHRIDVEIRSSNSVTEANPRLEELGFHSQAAGSGVGTRLVDIYHICIQPVGACTSQSQSHFIYNVHQESRDEGKTKHTRLYWNHNSNVQPAQGMPYSTITGSFSYFAIYLDDMLLGRAYAAEHEVPPSFVEQSEGRDVLVYIKGVGFDGRELASVSTTIQF